MARRVWRFGLVWLCVVGGLLGVDVAVASAHGPALVPDVGQTVSPPPTGGREVPQLRTERSRTWVKPNGMYVTRVSQRAVNYRSADGSWQPIDNDLVKDAAGVWHNKAGSYRLSVPSDLSDGPVKVARDRQWVSFALAGADTAGRASGPQARFDHVAPGVSARWTAVGGAVKEQLVLADADADAQNDFSFAVGTSAGLTARPAADGAAAVVDQSGRVVFGLTAPFAVDAAGDRAPADAVTMSVSGSRLSVHVDPAWLAAPGRKFPVVVDPTVDLAPTRDCYFEDDTPNQGFCDEENLWVGWSDQGAPMHNHRAILKFDPASAIRRVPSSSRPACGCGISTSRMSRRPRR